jgi:hypothetical protein
MHGQFGQFPFWQQLRQSSLPQGCGGLFQGKAIDAWGACLLFGSKQWRPSYRNR